ncbi:hypothetical protein CRM22_010281 [Opisthorchis felineus]|uniref:Peptidase A1 domain-containing protein n=1 Tax=Opisthorchis felineus TaxID=147828 RepID=A0A4S2L5L8_OPIFE|nr:hypothetical protein CRM22_010281 [Opisthorchis felineus]
MILNGRDKGVNTHVKAKTRSSRAGLQFPVDRVHRLLRKGYYANFGKQTVAVESLQRLRLGRMRFAEQDIFRERHTVLLDSANPYICGPVELIKRLHAILGCTKDDTEDCRFNCADDLRFPTLSISFPGFQTSMNQHEYFMTPTDGESTRCRSIFLPLNNEKIWLFGVSFLKKFCTTFNEQLNAVSFSRIPC